MPEVDGDSSGLNQLSETSPNPELVNEIGAGPQPFPVAEARQFKPWHRPHKQFVRSVQWLGLLSGISDHLGLAGKQLRYLTLPGDDLLDIWHLHDALLVPRDMHLRFLGFNDADGVNSGTQISLNSSLFGVGHLDRVDPESQVLAADIRLVGRESSPAWQTLRRVGSFHAINLDLCSGFAAAHRNEGIPNYFEALDWILKLQASADHASVLFVTSRCDYDSIDLASKDAMISLAREAAEDCPPYLAELISNWELPPDSSAQKVFDAATDNEKFMLGFAQWVIKRSVVHGLRVKVKSFMSYRTGSGSADEEHSDDPDDLLSMAFWLEPLPTLVPDPSGLSTSNSVPASARECEQAEVVPKRTRECVRVDNHLREHPANFDECVEESADLLERCGYDREEFLKWVVEQGAAG